ncbi:hypothetical protein [Hymenobacter sp. YC55]|uniref:hypothetical protein n=1 Tax=Hymenobacter sp. YC55 TaxID=3034019 RepID=UPI0023F89DD3|nr:hypothetical protein [Hymenobacter sp. YC55]MDF7810907.1 hypothetical protein [Hymenobacter sp. YC55]
MPTEHNSTFHDTLDKLYSAWLKLDAGDAINIVVPVVLFFAGLFFSRWIEDRKESARLKEIEAYYLSILSYLYNSIISQKQCIEDTKDILRKNYSEESLAIEVVPTFTTEHIKKIPQTDLYKIFINRGNKRLSLKKRFLSLFKKKKNSLNTNILNFYNIQAILDFIDVVKPKLTRQSELIIAEDNAIKEDAVKYEQMLVDEYNKRTSISFAGGAPPPKDALTSLIESILTRMNSEQTRLSIHDRYRNYVQPIASFLQSQPNSVNNLEFGRAVILYHSNYVRFVANRGNHIKTLGERATNLNVAAEQMKQAVQDLNTDFVVETPAKAIIANSPAS